MGIEVLNISKRFDQFIAVDRVSFKVKEGEMVALLGPSGCGKSTILRIIAGLEVPDSGAIHLNTTDVTNMVAQKRKVGFVFQHYALFKHMTVMKNIAFGMEIQKRSKQVIQKKTEELIELVRLKGYEKHYPDQLSGGQRQRVALARALAAEPRVLLLDEPFGALDAKVRKNLAQWLREFHEKLNVTSIFVTHDQNEAFEISDTIVVINRGRIEQIGTAREVYENPNSKFVASFIGKVNVLDSVVLDNQIQIKGTQYTIPNDKGKDLLDGDIVLLIRPEAVKLSRHADELNSIPCIIDEIHYRGSHYEIDCSIKNQRIRVIEDKNSMQLNSWFENQRAYLMIHSYQLFRADQGHAELKMKLKALGYIE